MAVPLSLYFHWPFCASKCPYCDFNSHVRQQVDAEMYIDAMIAELDSQAKWLSAQARHRPLTSIFIGGGTPSLMPPAGVARLLNHVKQRFCYSETLEITMEGNPSSIELQAYHGFKEAGVNRVSVGIQSLRQKHLQFLGRRHNSQEALQALADLKSVFSRVNFDMIYALPGQSLAEWTEDLKAMLAMAPSHLSLYQLTIEENTPFYHQYHRGDFTLPQEDLAYEMAYATRDLLEKNHIYQYEVSNFARAGEMCRHNLGYWRYHDYLGIGPGAHGRLTLENGTRILTEAIKAPETWCRRVQATGLGLRAHEQVPKVDQIFEHLLMNFRITDGVERRDFHHRHGIDVLGALNHKMLDDLVATGYLVVTPQHVTLTQSGLFVYDRIMRDLLLDRAELQAQLLAQGTPQLRGA